jgi:hypothetical protein
VGKSVSDLSEVREITIMVEQEMELDGALGLTIDGPVEERDTQFNEGSVETKKLILEAELLLSRSNHPALLRQLIEDYLIEPEGSFFIGIGEGGTRGALLIPRCLSFPRQLARPSDIPAGNEPGPTDRRAWPRTGSVRKTPFAPLSDCVSLTAR